MKLKTLLLTITFATLPAMLLADSYSSMWKQANAAMKKDQPRTHISILKKIASKAASEKAYGHLLKAQMQMASAEISIAPDSLQPIVRRIEALEAEASTTDIVLADIYRSVLGYIYEENLTDDEDSEEKSRDYYERSLENADALAKAYSTGYEPFVEDGIDSQVFGDDMLHVLGIAAKKYKELHNYYLAHGNRAAACISAALVLRHKEEKGTTKMSTSKYLQEVDSLINAYSDLTEAGELAIERYDFMSTAEDATAEQKVNYIDYALTKWGAWPRMSILRNARRRLTLPSFHVSTGTQLVTPNTPRQVLIQPICNISQLTMTVSRVNINDHKDYDLSDSKTYAKVRKLINPQPIQTETRRYIGQAEYKENSDTMEIKGLPIGVYIVEFTTNNMSVPVERTLLRVSDMYVVSQTLPNKTIRWAVVNATTGQPIPNAHINVTTRGIQGAPDEVKTLDCDARGEATSTYVRRPTTYYAYTDKDVYAPQMNFGGFYTYYESNRDMDYVGLYTDRRIYRPGQSVHVAAIVYNYKDKTHSASTLSGKQLTLTLRDANYKEIGTQTVTTDEYGTASADFALPQSGLTGTFSVRCDYGRNGYTTFSVEEYKRPTFSVDFDELTTKYQSGDTVTVVGRAKSFAGVPVQGARVAYTVVRRPSLLWHYTSRREGQTTVSTDTLYTTSDGSFSLRIPMQLPETMDERPHRYYTFDISADVTDASGETRHGETAIPLSDQPTIFTFTIPERMERDSTQNVVFEYKNNAGKEIDGNVVYYIDNQRHECKANTAVPLSFRGMTSKKYHIRAICGTDTISKDIVAFSLTDKKAVVETHDWFYQSATEFPTDGHVYVQVGSSDSIQHVMYTVLAGNEVLENGCFDLNGELQTRQWTYKESYGDGLTLTYAWVKGGILYRHKAVITRPKVDRQLTMKWTTFRDKLTPGQKETWTLNITRPDGSAAKAQLLSAMYDKSLDEIRQHNWTLTIPEVLRTASTSWMGYSDSDTWLYGEMTYKPFDTRELQFSNFDEVLSRLNYGFYEECYEVGEVLKAHETIAQPRLMMAKAATADGTTIDYDLANSAKTKAYSAASAEQTATDDNPVATVYDTSGNNSAAGQQSQIRENLTETAFFYPTLTTDLQGNVKIAFTLPESITTWRFMALSHDMDMNIGYLEDEAVAKKTVMVQPNMPRFVRSADKGSLSARLMNTSAKNVKGIARCEMLDPETEKVVYSREKKFEIKADSSTVASFEFDMANIENTGLLVCRITATGKGYSDGEQHYLPVLPDKELVTNTLPFTLSEAGTKTIDLKNLFAVQDKHNKLTVEYTDNPVWLMVQALPTLSTPENDNVISLATAYYANSLGKNIMQSMPAIKQTVKLWQQEGADGSSLQSNLEKNEELKSLVLSETPWLLDADRESEQKQLLMGYFDESMMQYRLASALSKLQSLQKADGSFSWWKGMDGSPYLTLTVAEMLVRLNSMIGEDSNTRSMVSNALKYVGKTVAKEVAEMKKAVKEGTKNPTPSDFAITYLYTRAIDNKQLSTSQKADNDYLVSLLEKQNTSFSIFDKARAAIIMSKNDHATKASELLQSIKEYTVYKEEMGRYFDTPKARYSWYDYRIPTQTAAIEALKAITPDDRQTIEEMQRWLLQSKRTQQWSTPINSVNAIYAFLGGNMVTLKTSTDNVPVIKVDSRQIELPKSTAGLGYTKTALTGSGMSTMTIEKKSEGTSWGAVYAQFMQPTTDVEAASSGLTITREVLKDGKRISSDGTVSTKVGDKLTVRITIQADRDYDFVQVSDKRAACMEPSRQLSGYHYGYYCEPKDNTTNYFFDCMRKGKHVIETTYYVDREGIYHTGTATAVCAYSPEFAARSVAMTVNAAK